MRRSKTDTATAPDPEAGREAVDTAEATAPDAPSSDGPAMEVGAAVVAFAGTDRESAGRIVDDFGDFTPVATEYDGERIAEPARRWAVLTAAGDLVFADSSDLTADTPAT